MGLGRGIEEEVKDMGDHDDEPGEREGMQEAETPSGTDASMREVQGLVDGDVHMVDGGTKEQYGMDVDGPALREDFRFDEDKDDEEDMHRLWSNSSSTALIVREESTRYRIIINPPPRPLNPLQGRVQRTSSLLLFPRKRRRRIGPRRRSRSRRFLLCRLLSLVP